MKNRILKYSTFIWLVSLPPTMHAENLTMASPGFRWKIGDDSGWSALYERLGVKGTLAEQNSMLFVEVIDGEYSDDSTLEVFVNNEGQAHAKRMNVSDGSICIYNGQIDKMPNVLNGYAARDQPSTITGSYTCSNEPKRGVWTGKIEW